MCLKIKLVGGLAMQTGVAIACVMAHVCCEVQVGAGGIKAITQGMGVVTMDEILRLLMMRAKLEAEEAQRECLFTLVCLSASASLILKLNLRRLSVSVSTSDTSFVPSAHACPYV